MHRRQLYADKHASAIRNERLTALAGAVLFILIVTELVITANLHTLISVHIFVGILLSGPLVVKMFSTGYRFFRFYTNSPTFVRKGPPNIWLRILAPFLVFITILVFISGWGLAVAGPTHMGLFLKIHAASVALWLPLLAVHVYAYLRKVPRLIASDWTSQPAERVSGHLSRLWTNMAAILVGIVAAIFMIPVSSPWNHWRITRGIPSPLILGLFAALFAVFIAVPILRSNSRKK
ncbi:hypothetical protein [Alicyclobacillus acidoterrestris]|uniref:DUF4405 domain-containing protein n=2 Tax=Alicyclobacillus TaxID=29330 RepID=A0A9E6ZEC0_ALIAG|nr:hypothetical protein [Alicyclobacillus acidoterrestris]UNO47790.1 hypothetical protein K1I37_13980 [Alicyclobacillus acidoterrestris]